MFSQQMAVQAPRTAVTVRCIVFVAMIVASLALVTGVIPAQASYYGSAVSPGKNVRACADTTSRCRVVTTTTSSARMQCWRDGGVATGRYRSARWFLLELSNGQEGFVHSSFVTRQVTVPNCGSLARVRAVDWALTQFGSWQTPEAYAAYVEPGPDREWSGDCLAFARIAYENAGLGGLTAPNAIEQWNRFQGSGLARSGTLPRYGDPVFTNIAPVGHVGLYIGGKSMIGTQGTDGSYLPVTIYSMYDKYPSYLGWARLATR